MLNNHKAEYTECIVHIMYKCADDQQHTDNRGPSLLLMVLIFIDNSARPRSVNHKANYI